jgi:hypothetical protein
MLLTGLNKTIALSSLSEVADDDSGMTNSSIYTPWFFLCSLLIKPQSPSSSPNSPGIIDPSSSSIIVGSSAS